MTTRRVRHIAPPGVAQFDATHALCGAKRDGSMLNPTNHERIMSRNRMGFVCGGCIGRLQAYNAALLA